MKINVRIPNKEQFSYTELEFDSVEEYEKVYPVFYEKMLNILQENGKKKEALIRELKGQVTPF